MIEQSSPNSLWKLVDCRCEVMAYVKQSHNSGYSSTVLNLEKAQISSIYADKEVSFSELSRSYLFNFKAKEQLHFFYGINLDQFAPQYYYNVLFNLYSLRDKIEADLDKLEPMMDDYMAFEELLNEGSALDARQHKQKAKFEKIFLDFWLNYRRVVSIVGGFLMLEHFDDFLPKMIQKYHFCCKRISMYRSLSKINDRILTYYDQNNQPLPNKLKKIKKLGIKVDSIQRQMKDLDHKIWSIERDLDDLRAFYKSEPAFQMHERYRDNGLCLNYLTKKELKILQSEILAVEVDKGAFSSKQPETQLLAELQLFKEDILSGRKQVLQQSEIQTLYNYLAQLCDLLHLTASSLLSAPFALTKTGRHKIGNRLLRHRPKLIIWENLAEKFADNALTENFLFLLQVLAEQEYVLNLLAGGEDSCYSTVKDNIKVYIDEDKIVRAEQVAAQDLEQIKAADLLKEQLLDNAVSFEESSAAKTATVSEQAALTAEADVSVEPEILMDEATSMEATTLAGVNLEQASTTAAEIAKDVDTVVSTDSAANADAARAAEAELAASNLPTTHNAC